MRSVETSIRDSDLVARRRNEICDAAYRVFVSKGFHRSTMRQIAAAARIGIGSLYDYIRRKEDLLDLIYERTMSGALKEIRAGIDGIDDPEEQLRTLIRLNLEIMHCHQDFFLLMYQESHVMSKASLQHVFAVEGEYVNFYRSILVAGVERGVFQVGDVDLASVAIAFLSSVWALKRWNLRQHALEKAIEVLTDLVLRGVKAPRARAGA